MIENDGIMPIAEPVLLTITNSPQQQMVPSSSACYPKREESMNLIYTFISTIMVSIHEIKKLQSGQLDL
ncbi:hypothetical protein D3C76_1831800 [compost metagenome]